MRNHKSAVEKTSFANIGNSAIDHDTRVENFVRLLWWTLAAENSAHRRQIQHVTFVRSDDEANVSQSIATARHVSVDAVVNDKKRLRRFGKALFRVQKHEPPR